MKQRAQTGRGRSLVILAAFGLLAATRLGAENHEFWPGVSYDPVVPTFEEVLGHGPGERITSHAEIMRYLGALAAAMPDRMKVFDYARTWEGRELRYGVIGSEANIARLEQIRTGTQRLADPRRLDRGEAERLIASLPVTV